MSQLSQQPTTGFDELLRIEGLTLERGGRRLLHQFDLSVAAGDLLWIEGANGSGKTSLLRYMAGLSPSSGRGKLQRSEGEVLYLGHKPAIKSALTARENLQWYCRAHGWGPDSIEVALQRVGLLASQHQLCQHLSLGQQRRVGLARIYLSEASLWLLDEPFSAMDAAGVRPLVERMVQHVGGGGAVVLASHQALPVDYPVRKLLLEFAA